MRAPNKQKAAPPARPRQNIDKKMEKEEYKDKQAERKSKNRPTVYTQKIYVQQKYQINKLRILAVQ